VTGASTIDADHNDVSHHLEGNFPRPQTDLNFRFTLREGQITRLVIEQ